MEFIPVGAKKDFGGQTLVLPSLTTGNVGQLCIDLLICSFNLQRVGFFDCAYVAPMIGNDPFGGSSGSLVTALEVFQGPNDFVLLQQRSPVNKGHHQQFVDALIKWVIESKIKDIVILSSADKFSQLEAAPGSFLKYRTNKVDYSKPQELGWTPLEKDLVHQVFKSGTFTTRLVEACQKSSIDYFSLIFFVAEGNNVMDGVQMAHALHTLYQFCAGDPEWKLPSSWEKLWSSGPSTKFLF